MRMVSPKRHQTFKAVTGTLLIGGAAPCQPCFSQLPLDEASSPAQRIVERIQRAESEDVNSSELIAPLTALALLYQESDAHDLASAVIERARQIVRINYGLYSLEEAPLLLQAIRSEEARGNVEAVWELEQSALTLALRHPGDSRTIPIYRRLGGSRLAVLEDYIAGGFPPQIVLGCYYGGRCRAGSSGAVVAALWRETVWYFSRAIDTEPHGEFGSDARRAFVTELLRTSYLNDLPLNPRSLFVDLLAHDSDDADPTRSRAYDVLLLADWTTLALHQNDSTMTRRQRESIEQQRDAVLRQYERAHRELQSSGVEQATIDRIFEPALPVVLPAFLPNPLVSEDTRGSSGYVDVAFEITPHGEARNIEVLETSTNATRRVEKQLVRRIEDLTFRPRMTSGTFAASRAVIRYYLDENESPGDGD